MSDNRVAGVWMTASAIAERDGVSRQAVAKHVAKLIGSGLEVQRDGQGRVAAINVADYDRLRSRYADPSKAQAPRRSEAAPPPPDIPPAHADSYDEAIRRKTNYEAEKRRLELEEMRGDLVRRADVSEAIVKLGQAIIAVVDRMPTAADDIAAAVASQGTHGARIALKRLAVRQRERMVAAIESVLAAAPGTAPEAGTDDDASPFETPPFAVTGAGLTAEPRLI